MDLSKYQIPLGNLPLPTEVILAKETIEFEFNDCTVSGEISNQELEDGIYKNKENSYFIKCTTQMNGVTPATVSYTHLTLPTT